MSSEATRSYKAGHVEIEYGAVERFGTENLVLAIFANGDEKYVGVDPQLSPLRFLMKPAYDSSIPSGATLSEVVLTARIAGGSNFENLGSGDGIEVRFLANPSGPMSAILSFPAVVEWDSRGEIKDSQWMTATHTFTTSLPSVADLMSALWGLGITGILIDNGVLYVDEVDFDITFTLAPSAPQSLSVYDVTPYSAKVCTGVATEQCINASYPMNVWFEWTSVDPTNDDGLLFIQTTPEQTFTSDPSLWPDGRPGQFIVYDTLPSPLDVQNPRSRLQPNTTYWVRAASRVNGETLYSAAWTSFTTPENDKVTL